MLTTRPEKAKPRARHQMVELILNDQSQGPSTATREVPQSLSLVAFKDSIEFSYLIDNFVWRTYGTPWLEMSCSGKLGQLSLNAARAFAQTVFGRHHHQRAIELQGQAIYGDTIRTLSQELNHVAQPGSEYLIVPVLLLLMHASTVADRQASLFHVTGLNRVIQSCEPARFATMPLRLAFESARSTLFTVGLVAKKRIFLEQAIWKTAPWQGSGLPPKTAQNELVDIMVGIPGYMQDTVEIQQGGAKDKQKKALLLARLKADLSTLFDWRWKWEAHNPNAAIEMEPGALPVGRRVCDFRLFRKVLWFRNFTQATEILLYNAVLLCLLGALWQFDPPAEVEVPAPTNSILKRPDEIFSLLEPAEEICRGFEYQLLNIDNSQDSTLFWLLPLGVASKVLEAEPEYGRWIQSMLDTSRVTRGYGSGMSEFAFGHYQFPHIGHARKRRMRDR